VWSNVGGWGGVWGVRARTGYTLGRYPLWVYVYMFESFLNMGFLELAV